MSKSYHKGYILSLLTLMCISLFIPISSLAQTYDPDIFNSESLPFSGINKITPEGEVNLSLGPFSTLTTNYSLTFDIPENLFGLEQDLDIEYRILLQNNKIT